MTLCPSPQQKEFNSIFAKLHDELARYDEAKEILSDIHDQLEKTGEVAPFTAARLRIFMEGK